VDRFVVGHIFHEFRNNTMEMAKVELDGLEWRHIGIWRIG
jgi:hypothetical protein